MKRWLSKYLSILILIPFVVLISLILIDLMRANHDLHQANKIIYEAKLVNVTNALVHEMQKERGMTAGFISSNGKNFISEIEQQRRLTDTAINQIKHFFESKDLTKPELNNINLLFDNLNNLISIRADVDSLNIAIKSALSYYTHNNRLVLELNGSLAALLEETLPYEKFLTIYNVGYIKESAGIERAILSSVFTKDRLTQSSLSTYVALLTKQDIYYQSAYLVAPSKYKPILDAFKHSDESIAVQYYRDLLTKNEQGFNIQAIDWFSAATKRINKLRETELTLLDEVTIYAQEKVAYTQTVMAIYTFILLFMICLAFALFRTIQLRAYQSADINRFMRKVGKEKDLTDSVEVMTDDELGKIASLINIAFMEIREDFISFQSNANQIGEATQQAAASTEQSKSNLSQLQLDISSIASATEEMTCSISSVMSNMSMASNEAENAARETSDGKNAVAVSMTSIKDTAQEVALVGETINELNSRVMDILGMVDVIKSVAEQTNLLALNAAIEAARAGEQGRGFAVVADEVRSLAMRTKQSTQEISDVVEVLKLSSQKAFDSIETGNKQAQGAVENSNKVSAVLTNIIKNITLVDDATRTVASSTQEQGTVIQSINTNISHIDEQARENVIGIGELSESSITLSNIANEMESRIRIYKV